MWELWMSDGELKRVESADRMEFYGTTAFFNFDWFYFAVQFKHNI